MSVRNLLNRSTEFTGLDQRFWLMLETGGYGDSATNSPGIPSSATEAIGHINGGINFNIPREDAAYRSGRSVVTRLSKKKEVKWNMETYIVPGAPDGNGEPTLPDAHAMLLTAFGAVDTSDPETIEYSLAHLSSNSFRLLEEGTHFSRMAVGCVCDTVTFTLPGDGKAMMKFDGFAQDVYLGGESTLAQAVTGSAVAASAVRADLTFTADTVGSAGNEISVAYTGGGTAGAEVVSITGGTHISVQIESGVSTATQIKAALDGDTAAALLINTAITGTGSNAQTTHAAVFLAGGLGAYDIKVADGEAGRFDIGAYINTVNASDGTTVTNANRIITAKGTGHNSDILTLNTSALSAAASASIVIGATPDFTPQGPENALLGLRGSFTTTNLGTVDCQLLKAEISIKNNYTPKSAYYGTSKICGYTADKRRAVSVKLEVLLTKDNFEFYSNNKTFLADGLTIVLEPQDIPAPLNDATGRTLTFTLPKVEFNVPDLQQPTDGIVKLSLDGVALAQDASTLDTEMTLTIT